MCCPKCTRPSGPCWPSPAAAPCPLPCLSNSICGQTRRPAIVRPYHNDAHKSSTSIQNLILPCSCYPKKCNCASNVLSRVPLAEYLCLASSFLNGMLQRRFYICIFDRFKKRRLFGADGQVGLWSRGASNWICGATSLFLLLPSNRHRNKQRILFWPSTTPLLRRDQFGGKEHSFHNFSAIIAKKYTKKHDFLFELHRVHWGVGL